MREVVNTTESSKCVNFGRNRVGHESDSSCQHTHSLSPTHRIVLLTHTPSGPSARFHGTDHLGGEIEVHGLISHAHHNNPERSKTVRNTLFTKRRPVLDRITIGASKRTVVRKQYVHRQRVKNTKDHHTIETSSRYPLGSSTFISNC